jgi:hypothetical protein
MMVLEPAFGGYAIESVRPVWALLYPATVRALGWCSWEFEISYFRAATVWGGAGIADGR